MNGILKDVPFFNYLYEAEIDEIMGMPKLMPYLFSMSL